MVELVHGELFPGPEEQAVRPRRKGGVAKADQPPDLDSLPGQDARHGPDAPLSVFQRLAEVEEASALGHGGQACRDSPPDALPHQDIFTQRLRMELRVAAGQVKPADPLRQGRVPHRAERDRLCPGGGKGLQRFGVGKAERLIPRHRDFDTLFFVFLFDPRCCRGRLLTEGKQFFPMDIFFGSLCQQGDLLL